MTTNPPPATSRSAATGPTTTGPTTTGPTTTGLPATGPITPWPAYAVIFLTGFSFLLYEVAWNRLLALVLGATVTASTLVLATFMAGFGAGALVWGRQANRSGRPGALLGVLLGGMGVLSLVNYKIMTGMLATVAGAGPFLAAVVLLFLPAFLMGGVYPVLSRLAVSDEAHLGSVLGRLYAVETLGSALGGLVTGFVLLGSLGQRDTIFAAAALNLLVGGVAGLAPAFRHGPVAAPDKAGKKDREEGEEGDPRFQRPALLGAFVTGLAILGLQVLWMRMFRIYVTNTSYTFALVSSVSILGLFAGSFLFGRRRRHGRDLRWSLHKALLGIVVTTGVGLFLLLNLPKLLMFPFAGVTENPAARVLLLPMIAALLIIFPPTLFSGYTFPLVCRMYAGGVRNLSRDVGRVLMTNTLGSTLGPLLAAFVLLPLLGAAMAVLLLMAVLVGAALLILRWEGRQDGRKAHRKAHRKPSRKVYRNVLAAGAVALLVLVAVGPDWRVLPPSFSRFEREVLQYRESVEGTLTVGRDVGTRSQSQYTFVNNSAVIGSTYDAVKVVKMVGHFPFLLGVDGRDVLVIGFGIGVTTSAIAQHPQVRSIECVELVPGLKDAARYYRELNNGVADDPRLSIIPGDGRHYLQTTRKKYDLISCDPTHPILGSGALYTAEYFQQCREHLKPGGMVSQYLPLHKLRPEEFLGIVATFHSVFPHSTVWLGHYHAVLLGGLDPLTTPFRDWADAVSSLGKDNNFYLNAYHLAATLVLDGPAIAKLTAGLPINTDDRSYTEFFATDCLREDNIVRNLKRLAETRVEPGRLLTDCPRPDLLARYLQGNNLLTESLYFRLLKDNERSRQLLQEAIRANPEDQEFPFLMKLYF